MSPPKNRVPRAARPWSWLAGIFAVGLLVAGVLALAMVLWDHVDMQALTRAPQVDDRAAPAARAPAPAARPDVAFAVHLYASPASESYFPDTAFLPGQFEAWGRRVESLGGRTVTIEGGAEVRELSGTGTVVVPSAVCLASDEVDALYEHASRGGNLLLTGATGARDERCEWLGWTALQDLVRAQDVRQLESRPGVYLTIPGGSALSVGVPSASRVEMRWDAQVALEVDGPRLYWSDWAMNPSPAEETTGVDAGAHLHRDSSGGRVAWFGFHGAEGVDARDAELLDRILTNGLLWAAGVPQAALAPWPGGHQAALVVSQQVGWEFENAANLARVGRDAGLPITFFVTSRLALDHPELAETLLGAGEVASRSVDDREMAGMGRSDMRSRMEQSRMQIDAWADIEPAGFRPPGEAIDSVLLDTWKELGGRYVAGLTGGRSGSPEVVDTDHGPLVVLPRVLKDDYNVVVQDRVTGASAIASGLGAGVEKLRALGGLALLTTHTQITGGSRQIEALRQLLGQLSGQDGWWFATASQVADWTLASSSASVGSAVWDAEERRFEIEIRAGEGAPLEGAWIQVVLPASEGEWSARVNGAMTAFARTGVGISVPLPRLSGGEVARVVVEPWEASQEEGPPGLP